MEEGEKYAEEEGLMWSETSAKSGDGVQEVFHDIGKYSSPLRKVSDSLLSKETCGGETFNKSRIKCQAYSGS